MKLVSAYLKKAFLTFKKYRMSIERSIKGRIKSILQNLEMNQTTAVEIRKYQPMKLKRKDLEIHPGLNTEETAESCSVGFCCLCFVLFFQDRISLS